MGVEMSYQAIPADCNLIERASHDRSLGQMLCSMPHWFRHGAQRTESWPEGEALRLAISELARRYPGIDKRNLFLDRAWDELHYLLSATRREGRRAKASEDDLILDKAVRGGSGIADHVKGTQGIPVRYVTPNDVELIAVILEPMTIDDLRIHYAPVKMERVAVYKFGTDRAGAFEASDGARCFASFRAFYLEAARHGEGVLVCLD